jgi:hypothetical protein
MWRSSFTLLTGTRKQVAGLMSEESIEAVTVLRSQTIMRDLPEIVFSRLIPVDTQPNRVFNSRLHNQSRYGWAERTTLIFRHNLGRLAHHCQLATFFSQNAGAEPR